MEDLLPIDVKCHSHSPLRFSLRDGLVWYLFDVSMGDIHRGQVCEAF